MPDITSDLKLWMTFDDSGATTADSSGNGNTGTLTGGPPVRVKVLPTGPGPAIGSALDFNGTSDYVNVPANAAIGNLTASFTIAAWLFFNNFTGAQYTIWDTAESPSAALGFALWGGTGTGIFNLTTKGVKDYTFAFSGVVQSFTWAHVAVVLDASFDATLYINGIARETITHTVGANANTTQATFIGASPDNTTTPTRFWFDGNIDDFRIYGRALVAADIAALYLFTDTYAEPNLSQFPKPLLQLPMLQGRVL